MAFKTSSRGTIPPFIVMEVMRAAAKRASLGADVFHLEIGQPGTGAPAKVIEAAEKALRSDRIGYTLAFGIPELREAIANHYGGSYGVEVSPEDIAVTTGSSGAFLLAFLSAFDVGDRVALASPGYPAYRHILTALGLEPVLLSTGPDERFQPTPALIEEALKSGPIDGLIVASPSNPTGTMLSGDDLSALAATCEKHGIRLISDEIYHGITFGEPARTMREFAPHAFIVNSFSKYFSMTGWRLGWMVMPRDLVRSVESLAQNLFISPPTLSQIAAVAAFDSHEELQQNLERYRINRSILLNELPAAGFDDLAPSDGAFYIYADVGKLTNDSEAFAARILNETGVAVTPGVDFDGERGHRTMRFSFAGSTGDMEASVKALKAWRR